MKKQKLVEVFPGMEAQMEETLRLVRQLSEHVLTRDPVAVLRSRPKRIRILKCTQALFDTLPGLVTKEEFQDWTGMSDEDLYAERKAGRIAVFKPDEHGYALYYKREIARLTGFKL